MTEEPKPVDIASEKLAYEENDKKPNESEVNEECMTTFEPVTKLEATTLDDGEKNFIEITKLRAKIYRYDTSEDQPQYKERGTGLMKIVRVKNSDKFRIVMRRDKTLKLCANHYIVKGMELKPMSTNEKAWVWNTLADNCDGETSRETFACRFSSVKDAQTFKTIFNLCTDPTPENIKKLEGEIEKNVATDNQECSKSNSNPSATVPTTAKSTEESPAIDKKD